jgi:hypothetical protein
VCLFDDRIGTLHELSEELIEFYKYFLALGTGKSEN